MLFALSDWLETKATAKARNAIEAIIALRPERATLLSGETVDVEEVVVGTLLAVRSGDKVPIDGIVHEGETALDESNLTGESRPVRVEAGDAVSAGTINVGGGYLVVETTALSGDSAVARLVQLV